MKIIAGVLRPQHGRIPVRAGRHADRRARAIFVVRSSITLVRGTWVFPQMTVQENLFLGAHRASAPALPATVMERAFTTVSPPGGAPQPVGRIDEWRRAADAGHCPRPDGGARSLIVLDKPSLGLMPKVTQELFRLIAAINQDGLGVLLVEQNLHQSLRIAHRGYVLEKGEVVMAGTGKELLANDYVGQTAGAVGLPTRGRGKPAKRKLCYRCLANRPARNSAARLAHGARF